MEIVKRCHILQYRCSVAITKFSEHLGLVSSFIACQINYGTVKGAVNVEVLHYIFIPHEQSQPNRYVIF